MSNIITAGAALALSGVGVNVSASQQNISVAQTGNKYVEQIVLTSTTAGGTAIPVSNLANLGFMLIQNLDTLNYVDVMTGTTGAGGVAFARLMPGDPPFLFRWTAGITAPALLAHGAAALVSILMMEN